MSTPTTSPKPFAILIENEFDALQVRIFQEIFATAGIETSFLSHLWGHESLEFIGDDPEFKIQVNREIAHCNPEDFSGVLLPGGYAMDRLRYQVSPVCGQPNQAPAVNFLRAAVGAMNEGKLKIGAIGHGLMLFTAAPELLHGRHVTCAHNIINDVANAGGIVMFNGNQTADIHSDRCLFTGRDSTVAGALMSALATAVLAAS